MNEPQVERERRTRAVARQAPLRPGSRWPAEPVRPLRGLHHELGGAPRGHDCQREHRGLILDQQHLVEAEVAYFGRVPKCGVRRSQSYLAVGRCWKSCHFVYPVIGQPAQRRGSDLGLPRVALRLLGQAHMGAQQRMHGDGWSSLRLGVPAVEAEEQVTVRPCRQRYIQQATVGVQHREIHGGTDAVHLGQQIAHPVRQCLFAPHRGQSGGRRIEAGGGLLDGVGQQWVWRELDEHAMPIFQRRLHRGAEPHGVTQIVQPIIGIAERLLAWSNRLAE